MKRLILAAALACASVTAALADFYDGVFAYSRGEYEQAYNTLRPLAELSGHGLARYWIATMYLHGRGVKQSYDEAANWFRKAAEQGVKQAQYQLAGLYLSGRGVAKDYEYAYAWYRAAAAQQHTKSTKALPGVEENLSPEELEEAKKLARKFIRDYAPKEEKPPTADFQP